MNEIQAKFKELLLATKREGMENVIEKLEELGFFKAPASTKFHLNYDGSRHSVERKASFMQMKWACIVTQR